MTVRLRSCTAECRAALPVVALVWNGSTMVVEMDESGGISNPSAILRWIYSLWRSIRRKETAMHSVIVATVILGVFLSAPRASQNDPGHALTTQRPAQVGVGGSSDLEDAASTPERDHVSPSSRAPQPSQGAPSEQESSSQTPAVTSRTYVVQQGDTLSEIAERFGVSTDTLASANGLDAPDQLQVGQKLTVPSTSGVTHKVVEGDTIGGLAELYQVDASVIVHANNLTEPYTIRVGQTLFIPGGISPIPASGRATGKFIWPTYGHITFYFREDGYHKGLDIGNGYGTPIYAADGGIVTTALKLTDRYGWHIVIDHGNGFTTLYGHLSEMYVDYGDRVRRGEVIGLMGSTGYSSGPHLHFEVHHQGVLCDPLEYLP